MHSQTLSHSTNSKHTLLSPSAKSFINSFVYLLPRPADTLVCGVCRSSTGRSALNLHGSLPDLPAPPESHLVAVTHSQVQNTGHHKQSTTSHPHHEACKFDPHFLSDLRVAVTKVSGCGWMGGAAIYRGEGVRGADDRQERWGDEHPVILSSTRLWDWVRGLTWCDTCDYLSLPVITCDYLSLPPLKIDRRWEFAQVTEG